jgi:hypothetical protein
MGPDGNGDLVQASWVWPSQVCQVGLVAGQQLAQSISLPGCNAGGARQAYHAPVQSLQACSSVAVV